MSARTPAADDLAASLRRRILDGELAAGRRLVERDLVERHAVARHTVRAALRTLAAERLVALVPDRGAHVATPDPETLRAVLELRTALEVEAARLALERDSAGLEVQLGAAVDALGTVCTRPGATWSAVVEAHGAVHRAIVAAAGSPRITDAYRGLDGEMRLFVLTLRPTWSLERMAEHHDALAQALPREGPEALRRHLDEGAAVLRGVGATPTSAG